MKVHCLCNKQPPLSIERVSFGVFKLNPSYLGEDPSTRWATCAFSLCGKASWRRGAGAFVEGGEIVEPTPFVFLPERSQCQRCRSILKLGLARNHLGETIRQRFATPEQITAVEYGLVMLSRLYEQTTAQDGGGKGSK